MNTELEALVILTATPNLGSIKIRFLIEHFGSANNALDAEPADLLGLPGFSQKTLKSWAFWKNDSSWEKDIALAEKLNVEIIPYTNPKYPKRLLEISDHPILLYVKGSLKPDDSQSIAVVGTRNSTIYGLDMAERISHDLASMGFTVVSGLARGVDTCAHTGALQSGRTIAVIGSGLANIYPRENIELSRMIEEKGAVISEFPMTTPPDRQNFPQRNRIVSGMTQGTLLIEAPMKSGAMITMHKAEQQGRPLFAIPGRCNQENFQGNHHLIKQNRAKLIESATDIAQDFDSLFSFAPSDKKKTLPSLEKEELNLLHLLPDEELTVDDIVHTTKLPVMKLNVLLMSLVIKKVVKEYPGKIYKKLIPNG